jgi:hypothetical protein
LLDRSDLVDELDHMVDTGRKAEIEAVPLKDFLTHKLQTEDWI